MEEHLEWVAFAIGTVGTAMWAIGFKWRGRPMEGWFWLVSALLWIWFAVVHQHGGLAARDLLGVVLYVIGILKVNRSMLVHGNSNSWDIGSMEGRSSVRQEDCVLCLGTGVHRQRGPGVTSCPCRIKNKHQISTN